ncbi:MAG: hypothetical protein JW819_03870 [Candidatus Krumholzibacteriota bacterium]|nr:hypothetical protein [Candidatus Krumholzibacteriota bacterium]
MLHDLADALGPHFAIWALLALFTLLLAAAGLLRFRRPPVSPLGQAAARTRRRQEAGLLGEWLLGHAVLFVVVWQLHRANAAVGAADAFANAPRPDAATLDLVLAEAAVAGLAAAWAFGLAALAAAAFGLWLWRWGLRSAELAP